MATTYADAAVLLAGLVGIAVIVAAFGWASRD
jgi:hypothetical protein